MCKKETNLLYKRDNSPVIIGDIINVTTIEEIDGKKSVKTFKTKVDDQLIGLLINNGQIIYKNKSKLTEKEIDQTVKAIDKIKQASNRKPMEVNMNPEYYFAKVGQKLGWNAKKLRNIIEDIIKVNPAILFHLMLREVALECDRQYKNHIENSAEIYVLSSSSGSIVRVDKSVITNYRNFSAFRTREDAKKATIILKDLLDIMFSNEDSK